MNAVATIEPTTTAIAAVVEQTPVVVLTDRDQRDAFYAHIQHEVDAFKPDTSTEKGRKAIKAFAYKITRTKTAIDDAGKQLNEEARARINAVDAERRVVKEKLTALAAEVRRPLTEWEDAEEKRVEACRAVIDGIKASAVVTIEDTAATVRTRGAEVWNIAIDDNNFRDMAPEAVAAKEMAVSALKSALARLTKEEADRAELDRLRAEAAAREERDRAEREAREAEERAAAEAQRALDLWSAPGLTQQRAEAISNVSHVSRCFSLTDYPRQPPASQYEGAMGLWSALTGGIITAEQAAAIAIPVHQRTIERAARWVAHYNNRVAYEYAMLEEVGETQLLAKPERPKQLPLCNYMVAGGLDLPSMYSRSGELEHYAQVAMTSKEYAAIYSDYKGTRIVGGSHRVRIAILPRKGETYGRDRVCVFLSDSKTHEPPAAVDLIPALDIPAPRPMVERQAPSEQSQQFEALRATAAGGVSIVVAPQLFPTPSDIAARMAEMLEAGPDDVILEPSAGTGKLLRALNGHAAQAHAVEINWTLANNLVSDFPQVKVTQADFMSWAPPRQYDRIIMNPPFGQAADIAHIKRAAAMLAPGGRLVALCAAGSRQHAALEPMASTWEHLPPGSFAEAGTGVNVVLLTINN